MSSSDAILLIFCACASLVLCLSNFTQRPSLEELLETPEEPQGATDLAELEGDEVLDLIKHKHHVGKQLSGGSI